MQKVKVILNKFGRFLTHNFYDILLWIIVLLNVLPLLAPLFAAIGWVAPAQVIYSIYAFFCHQLHWRSFHLFDHQFAWCSRCTSIWACVLITGILVKKFKIKPIKWYWILVLILPMALDGIIQTIATLLGIASSSEIYYMSNDLVRAITGALFGVGFGLWVWTILAEELTVAQLKKRKTEMSLFKVTIITILLFACLLIVCLWLWQITSPNYPPVDFWDFAVKIPVSPSDFLLRAKDAIF